MGTNSQRVNTEQERADFEAFMGKRYPDVSLKRFATGCYLVSMARHHWEGWKARAALQSQDAKDAERYRLLRRGQKWSVIDGIGNELRAEGLDAAIDHARRIEGERE